MNDSGLPEPVRNDLRNWASETARVPVTSEADRVRRAVFGQLSAHNFVPPDDWHEAVDVMLISRVDEACRLPDSYYDTRERELGQQVERFAQEFFKLDPEQRRARWGELHGLSQPWPPLRLWLDRLEPGLDVRADALENSSRSLQTLGTLICEKFVLPPPRQARLLMKELPLLLDHAVFWGKAARTMRRDFPDIAGLDKLLLSQFTVHAGTSQFLLLPPQSSSAGGLNTDEAGINVWTMSQEELEDEDLSTAVDGPITVAFKLVRAGLQRWVTVYRPLFDRRLSLYEKINAVPFLELLALIGVFIFVMIFGLALHSHYNQPPIPTWRPSTRTARELQIDAEEELRLLLLKEAAEEEAAEKAKQAEARQKRKRDDSPSKRFSFPMTQPKGRN
ncbi:MAG: hypothetical protein JWN70_1688 [Planctomycetaceae bacterium]|nr:hypothetical protein [Planctomycetaceae bacterium]